MTKAPIDWQDLLQKDEEILWQGTPRAEFEIHRKHLRNGVVWGIIAVCLFVIAVSLEQGNSVKTQMVITALILFGLAIYVSIGQMFLYRTQLKRTTYAITNKRALILSGENKCQQIQHDTEITATTKAAISGAKSDTLSFWQACDNPGDEYDGSGVQFAQLNDADQAHKTFEQALKANK